MEQSAKRVQKGRSMKGYQGYSEREDADRLKLRKPGLDDGARISALIESCKPLDTNSTYCYILLCRDFADTCVVAEESGEIIAFYPSSKITNKVWPFYRYLGHLTIE